MTLKIGMLLNTQDPPNAENLVGRWQENLRLAEIADSEGLDLLCVGEHHFRADGQLPAPLVAAAAIAARTRRVEIATTVSIGPLWQPLRLAEEAAMVDVLSGGRFNLGLGIGNFEPELRAFGVEKRHQARVFDELLDIVTQAFTGAEVSYDGRFHSVEGLRVTPGPLRRPFPVWLGGMSRPGVQRAARRGTPLILDPLHTIAELAPWVEAYRQECEAHGTQPSVKLLRYGWVTQDTAELESLWWPDVRELFWNYLVVVPRVTASSSRSTISQATEAADLRLDELAGDRLVTGAPDEVASEVRRMAGALGADTVVVRLQGTAGPAGEAVERAVRLLSGPVRRLVNAPPGGTE